MTGLLQRRTSMPKAAAISLALAATALAPDAASTPEATACIRASDAGQAHRDEGKLRAARTDFRACSRDACPGVVRTDCGRWLADVEVRIPNILVRVKDSDGKEAFDVAVSLDGEPLVDRLDGRLIPVDPGEHVVRFTRPDGATAERTTTIREGEKDRTIDVVLGQPSTPRAQRHETTPGAREDAMRNRGEEAPRRSGSLVLPLVLAGVAVAGGAVFGVMASVAKSDFDELERSCAPGCTRPDVNAVRTKLLIANVSLGVGIVALGAAAVSYFIGRSSAPTTALDVTPTANGDGAVGSLTRRF
jgi:hypothetical protein